MKKKMIVVGSDTGALAKMLRLASNVISAVANELQGGKVISNSPETAMVLGLTDALGLSGPPPFQIVTPTKGEPQIVARPPRAAIAPKSTQAVESCAIQFCGKPRRSKGYCGAHYQKLRLLESTDRRPVSWIDNGRPGSIPDVLLPRGRPGSRWLIAKAKK